MCLNIIGGDPLIPHEFLSYFKEIALNFIKQLESRNLEQLRKKILPYVKEIREGNNLKFNDNMLKKHKWSTFLHENPDVKLEWDNLPKFPPSKQKKILRNSKRKRTKKEGGALFNRLSTLNYEPLIDHEDFGGCNINISSCEDFEKEDIFDEDNIEFSFDIVEKTEEKADDFLKEWKMRTLNVRNEGFLE